jgi:Glutathione S-transferase, C-terminal domain
VLQLTWADLAFIVLVDNLRIVAAGDVLEKQPKLHALGQRVANLPKIAAWIDKRPKTEF